TARKSYAKAIFSIAEASYPLNEEITICSIGAGYCLQELLIHLEFSNNNKKVSWILIEPKFEPVNSTVYKAAMQFKQIMEFLSSGTSVRNDHHSGFQRTEKRSCQVQGNQPKLYPCQP
ncbi:MAG TPA: hypothetical protein PLX13_01485, partial [Saprospiraceae bacterium]|nr:hypothetical protein [Saprospiraceae bacterium]